MESNLLLKENKELKEILETRLRRYGLEIIPTTMATVHDRYFPEVPKVYVVYVKELKNPTQQYWVSMWASGVNKLDNPSQYWKGVHLKRPTICRKNKLY